MGARYDAVAVEAINKAYEEAVEVWDVDLNRYDSSVNFLVAVGAFLAHPVIVIVGGLPRNMTLREFCDEWDNTVLIKYANVVGRVTYRAVRPRESMYDKNYYAK